VNRALRALAAGLGLLAAAAARAGDGRLEVVFLDVGQGDAVFASTPSGRTVLVDAGPPESAGRLVRFLRSRLSEPLDVAVLTHPHADHVGGMIPALRIFGARHLYDPVLDHPSPIVAALHRFVAPLAREGALVPHRVRAGATLPVDFGDGVRLEFLAPSEPLLEGTRSDVNANSVVCRLVLGEVAILLASDAGRPAESRLLRERPASLPAAVLKVGHHGSRDATGPAFLRAVAPSLAVVTAGRDNAYGLPDPEVMARLERAHARVLRTDRDGAVAVRTDGTSVEVEALGPLLERHLSAGASRSRRTAGEDPRSSPP
jgi:beta-lactamase superfamily II metal-dependent hydrolase